MKILILPVLLFLAVFSYSNSWLYIVYTDPMTDAVTTSAVSPDILRAAHVKIACNQHGVHLLVESDRIVAAQKTAVTLTIRIDRNTPVELPSHMYGKSGSYAYRADNPELFDSIVDQMKAGGKALIYTSSEHARGETIVTLSRSSYAINKVYADCGLT